MKLLPILESLLLEWGTNYSEIVKSIKEEKVVELEYIDDNDELTKRVIEPFVIGYHKQSGNLVLRAYHYTGHSMSMDRPEWRMFRVDRIYKYTVTDKKFRTDEKFMKRFRRDYSQHDRDMKQIIYSLLPKKGWFRRFLQ